LKFVLYILSYIKQMEFSREQQIAFNKYVERKNIFITGPGGTGKSALIRYIQKDAYRKCFDIQVCALTGCAAVLLECKAKTVHSWAGIGLGNGPIDKIVLKVLKNRYAKATWKATDILVIDEVSMMSQKLFETLDAIGKAVRKNNKPFGGIQLIFSGDFYQLPPVGNKDEPETMAFCFQSPLWSQTFSLDNHVSLIKIFRQNDDIYQRILNQIREGRLRRSSNEALLHHVGKEIPQESDIRPTKLFPTRNKVDYINTSEMNKLTAPEIEYKIKYHVDLEMSEKDKQIRLQYTREQIQAELLYLQSNLLVDEIVKLKVGTQVMCVVNIQLTNGDMLCNGSQGIIVRTQEQGLPVVKYRNGIVVTMGYHIWASETIPGIGVSQIPLIPAWALTIHKAQGATLDIAEIDVGSSVFECGQTYVALSRVKSLDGLYLTSFDAKRIRINKKVQEFYEVLEEIETKRRSDEENRNREIEKLPEALAEPIPIPMVEAVAVAIVSQVENFNEFANELQEDNYE
jgi:ATP-dependent DNA helicase PIF1